MRAAFIIAANTMRDALRQRLVFLMAACALILTLFSTYIMKMDLGHDAMRFVANFTSGALGFFGSIIAITSVCQLFYSEMDGRTVTTLLSKPVGLGGFVFGKLLGEAYMLAAFTAVIMAVGAFSLYGAHAKIAALPEEALSGAIPAVSWTGFAVFGALQFAKLMAVAAMACFVCALSRSMMFAIVVSFLMCAASLLSYSDFMSGGGWALAAASWLLPNLSVFEPSLEFIFSGADAAAALAALGYAAAYVGVFGLLAVWMFSNREL